MPGMCAAAEEGGVGFDYRLGMAVPDFWIKLLKEVPDEQWDMLADVEHDDRPRAAPRRRTVAYCESHDQALVGDQTH